MTLLKQIKDFDRRRPGLPGEHFFTALTGSWLLRSAARRRTLLGKALAALAGGALLYRAASGRDGLARLTNGRHIPARQG
ncbi:MAG: hypothetical protein ACXW2G_00465 [Burkholderiaceae bacterium]